MAGPTLLILTPQEISAATRKDVETLVSTLSGGLTSGIGKAQDFHIAGRPFFMWFGSEFTDHNVDPDLPADTPLGFEPQGQIALVAMCNQIVDHILLATLTSRIATVLDGIILLDGDLHLDEMTRGFAGLTRVGSHSHTATAEFMHFWMESGDFRLPK